MVAFQLPNSLEAAAAFWGASFLGPVVVPIVHFYGATEHPSITGSWRDAAPHAARRQGVEPSLDDVRDHLRAAGLAHQKWPEELRVVDDFPRTPSSKIKKFALRDQVRQEPRGTREE